jgi:hypothetical protein
MLRHRLCDVAVHLPASDARKVLLLKEQTVTVPDATPKVRPTMALLVQVTDLQSDVTVSHNGVGLLAGSTPTKAENRDFPKLGFWAELEIDDGGESRNTGKAKKGSNQVVMIDQGTILFLWFV